MGFWSGVTPESVQQASDGFKEFHVGDNEASIKYAEQVLSNNGNQMLVIIFTNNEGAEIKHYIVDNEFKIQKLKQLYQAFGIPMGSTVIEEWRGRTGIVVCKRGQPYDGKIYNKVSYLRPKMSGAVNSSRQPAPVQTTPQKPSQPPVEDHFVDDIPF